MYCNTKVVFGFKSLFLSLKLYKITLNYADLEHYMFNNNCDYALRLKFSRECIKVS